MTKAERDDLLTRADRYEIEAQRITAPSTAADFRAAAADLRARVAG